MSKRAAILALAIAAAAQTHDTTPPALTAFSISPATVTAGSAAAAVTASFTATDDLSGVASVQICYTLAAINACTGPLPASGTSFTGTGTFTIPPYSAAGTWTPTVTLTDATGNVATLSGSALSSFTTALTVN